MKKVSQKEIDKIRSNGFTQKEFLKFRSIYKEVKQTFNPNITQDISLISIIKNDAKDAYTNIKLYIFAFSFFVFGSLIIATAKEALIFALIITAIAFFNIFTTAKEKKTSIATELKLIKLFFRLRY